MTRRRFPAIPGDLGRNTIARMKELLEIWSGDRGDQLDSVATLRDLVEANIARISRGGRMEAVAAGQDPVRVGPLSNLRVNGAFQNMIIEWGGISQPGYAYAEVWRGEADNLGDAVMIGASRGFVFTDPVGPGSSYYYWVRAVSTTGHPGPYNASAGTFGQTAPDVEYLLDKLEGEITETQFNQDLTSRLTKIEGNEGAIQEISEELTPLSAQWTVKQQVGDLVSGIGLYNDGEQTMFAVNANRFYITDDGTVPFVVDNGQTFIREALIQDAAITTAKIQDGFLDNLTAAKGALAQARIQKGDIFNLTIQDRIQSSNFATGASGWRVLKDGTAEFSNATFRGHVEMETGHIAEFVSIGGIDASTVRDRANNGNTAYDRVYNSWTRPGSTLIDGNKIFTGDAYVDTLQIKGQAVTFSVATQGPDGSPDSFGSGTQTELSVVAVWIDRTWRTPLTILASVTALINGSISDSSVHVEARVRAGSEVVIDWRRFGSAQPGEASSDSVTLAGLDSENRAGWVEYRLDLRFETTPTNNSFSYAWSIPYIHVVENKR